ncbi:MAG: alkaline phosphatase family protein [Cyclobacteriaceae bacterium]|nr:alkaline phosphatase family protein [Cyclobacteriaceae bacterium]UYN86030.1 MAG: alkaline phosphatase family protein [Cyclobacteriaceae bacterium]
MRTIISVFFTIIFFQATAQLQSIDRPRLVVGITVDQMRQEYIYRYYSTYGDNGFKRLINGGFMLENGHYNYIPTYTGAGHASIYTGTTPAIHGVIGNEWYDKTMEKTVYCVSDDRQKTVGSTSENNGKMSPHRMLTTTITDELKLATQKRSKVLGISVKDRGAILPAGHMADAAYWYDGKTGRFITSTFYMDKLPPWLEKFNSQQLADKYLSGTWNTLLPLNQYDASGADVSPYEGKLTGNNSTFPYDLAALRKTNGNFELLSQTPFSNDYLTELAKATIDGEKLGADQWTDFLAVSYSAPDIIGHRVGPYAIELQDVYIRLDKNIEDLLKKLDQAVGEGNYLVFLTADHAVAEVPQFLADNKVPAGILRASQLSANLGEFLNTYFPDRKVIKAISGEQIHLNHESFSADPRSGGVDLLVATELISNFLMQQSGIANVYPKSLLRQGDFNEGGLKGMAIRGYHPKRSGDMTVILEPAWFESGRIQGTTHGSPYTYDTHVPILFYGKGIKQGSSVQHYTITDIAPTLSMLLKIKLPNGSTGHPIGELMK